MFVYNMLYEAKRSILLYPGVRLRPSVMGDYKDSTSNSSCEMMYVDLGSGGDRGELKYLIEEVKKNFL